MNKIRGHKQWSVENNCLDNASIWALYECRKGEGRNVLFHNFLLTVTATLRVSLVTTHVHCKTQSLAHINPHLWSSETKSFCNNLSQRGHYDVSESECGIQFFESPDVAVVREWHMTWYLWADTGQSEASVDRPGTNERPGKRVVMRARAR